MKKIFVETNAGCGICFVDDNNDCFYLDETNFSECAVIDGCASDECTLENARMRDWSGISNCKTAEDVRNILAVPNSISGLILDEIYPFNSAEFEKVEVII